VSLALCNYQVDFARLVLRDAGPGPAGTEASGDPTSACSARTSGESCGTSKEKCPICFSPSSSGEDRAGGIPLPAGDATGSSFLLLAWWLAEPKLLGVDRSAEARSITTVVTVEFTERSKVTARV